MKAVKIHRFYCNTSIKNKNSISVILTKNTMWHLDSEYCLNGETKLNANIIREIL